MESMQSDFFYEFYNAGQRIVEHLRFSISASSPGFNGDDKEGYSEGFWRMDAPKEGFFRVPTEIQSGNEVIRVRFAEDIRRRFGRIGIVLVNAKWDPETEDPDKDVSEYPEAPTREKAVERGQTIWQLWLRRIVQRHLDDCQNALAAGGAPRGAAGFTKRAFNLLGVADPGEQYFLGLKEQGKAAANASADSVLAAMQQQQTAMMRIILAIASGQKIDPELLKNLVPKAGPTGPLVAAPVMSGVATGEIKKPIGEFDSKKAGLDAYDRKTKDRDSRKKEAAEALATS